MIVPVLMNFHSHIMTYNWLRNFEDNAKGTIYYIVQEKMTSRFTDRERAAQNIVIFPEKTEQQLSGQFENEIEFAYFSTRHSMNNLVTFFEDNFARLQEIEDITVVYALYKNVSLEAACRKRGLCLKYIELSALGKDNYYNFDLCRFLESEVMNSDTEGRNRYKEFDKVKSNILLEKPLTPLELLLIGTKERDVVSVLNYLLNGTETYDIGIALPWDYKEFCGDWPKKEMIETGKTLYGDKKILYRVHPGENIDHKEYGPRDLSGSSLKFISKCKTVVSSGSNISFEAMLFGKQVIDFSRQFYSDKIINQFDIKKKCGYDDMYLNFLYFSVFTPFELICDENYVKWRCCETPDEADIFNTHLKFICERYLNISYEELNMKDNRRDFIWDMRSFTADKERNGIIDFINALSEINWRKQRIIICGCGRDAVIWKSIVENFGGTVFEFLIMQDKKDRECYAGKRVVIWGETQYTEQDVFIISQRNRTVQKDILIDLNKKGVKNMICI